MSSGGCLYFFPVSGSCALTGWQRHIQLHRRVGVWEDEVEWEEIVLFTEPVGGVDNGGVAGGCQSIPPAQQLPEHEMEVVMIYIVYEVASVWYRFDERVTLNQISLH
jgi:hypothetical protein